MGNCDYQQSIRTEQIVFYPKLRANGSEARFTKKALKHEHPKKKKKEGTPKVEIFFESRFKRQL